MCTINFLMNYSRLPHLMNYSRVPPPHELFTTSPPQEEMAELREQVAARDKDMREAKSAYREAQDEVTRITDK